MLPGMEKIISVTDLVRNVSRIADEIEGGAIYRITRGGRGNMVLLDEEYFDGWMAAIEEMQRPGWQAALRRSRQDVAAGRGKDLESIVKELGLEDPAHRKPSSARGNKSRARKR